MQNKEVDFYINKKILKAWQTLKRYIVVYGGRGSGKSLQLGALCILFSIQKPNSRILAVRGTQNKISESSLQILKDVIYMMGLESYFDITEHTLTCKNGSEFLFYGAKNYQSFKSLQGIDLVFIDEATELSGAAWEVLIPTIRENNSRFLISFNPEDKTDWVYDTFIINEHPEASVVKINYPDNPFFPEVLQVEMQYDKSTNPIKYKHVWEGALIERTEGALWKKSFFNYDKPNKLESIYVAVDPSTTNHDKSDECGIIVAGKESGENKFFILDDFTAKMSPLTWATKAIQAYKKYEANNIIVETNQGGDMIKTIIHQIDSLIPVRGVRASKGKLTRAEPIAALYERGLVSHVRKFPELEYELLTYTGDPKQKSPNRLDALVWSLFPYLTNRRDRPGYKKADMSTINRVGTMRLRT